MDHPETLTPEPPFWYCPQSRLEPLLLAEARQRSGDVRYNTELVSFTQDEQGVTAFITRIQTTVSRSSPSSLGLSEGTAVQMR